MFSGVLQEKTPYKNGVLWCVVAAGTKMMFMVCGVQASTKMVFMVCVVLPGTKMAFMVCEYFMVVG